MALAALILVSVAGCSGGYKGLWAGSGEIGEARFFSFAVDLKRKVPVAQFLYKGGVEQELAVCELRVQERQVEFRMDPEARAASCDEMKSPLTFVGGFGQDVLTGEVLDGSGRIAGVFRAFRMGK
jgi:hypothetical protein